MKKLSLLFLLVFCSLPLVYAEFTPHKQYWISPLSNQNIRLDNRNNRVAQKNNVQTSTSNNHLAQRWRIDEFRNGVVLRSMNNENFVIENNEGILTDGNNICIKEFNGTIQQIWIMEECEPNVFIFRNADDPSYVMTSTEDNVELAKYANSPNQKWYLECSKPLILIEKDKNGKIILTPHEYEYESPKENHNINFSVFCEPGECHVGIENEKSKQYNSIYSEPANYSYDGKNIVIKKKNGENWEGTLSDNGKTLVMKINGTSRTYKICK